jgi:DNA invertase Pin-like site-specific DNA recombinase
MLELEARVANRRQGLSRPRRRRGQARENRPAFDALCKDAARRKFDMVMAWSVDRLGRSLQDLVGFLSEIHAYGIDLFLHQQGVDTTTPAAKALRRPKPMAMRPRRSNRWRYLPS